MNFSEYFKKREKEIINFLKELVFLESPTHDKNAVDKCSNFYFEELKKLGIKTSKITQKEIGDFGFAELPGKSNEKILVLLHIDTVWKIGKIKEMPFKIEGEKIFGPGVLDMKAGAVMVYFAFKAIKDSGLKPKKTISVFCNSEEETGSHHSEKFIIDSAKKSKYVLCLEPALPDGSLKMQRKGRMVGKLITFGKSAHGSSPHKGVNAIIELSHQLLKLKKVQKGGITINVGLIRGGEKVNVVPDSAEAILDIRFWKTKDKEKIIDFFNYLKPKMEGAKLKFQVLSFRPPMEKTRVSFNLFRRIKRIGKKLGIEIKAGKSGGGSDASFASNIGIPTVDGLGPVGNGIHSENEHLYIASLLERTTLLTELFLKL
ncbi:M20 family metallopeptidase [Candidatus Aminicenantes bacterium AC-335-A11]|jgi:glutamate carboxypeptidase|nr:M20 family metallopeptidase [SCandidatus Aminicenantes bacterium Aminicenantia_JdfR_composite]MCP2596300.1 M20 family metallopeptidase [Candidatus Aminicenantes bacterium AC-335-G13]MCP2597875.1 M20 family metallopeptidase [Candidatus Aminicenantes bacterium AC-335-L06]MCP2618135.1 M20 family metallopeptidase [Candidatus Aminicenantes bacterium AC-335-A11]MCP2620468.1 M20 family metallopeptidase [Candidatus Aminicenantes bacterium AC-334-E05]